MGFTEALTFFESGIEFGLVLLRKKKGIDLQTSIGDGLVFAKLASCFSKA